jgi:hypothetical protein
MSPLPRALCRHLCGSMRADGLPADDQARGLAVDERAHDPGPLPGSRPHRMAGVNCGFCALALESCNCHD